MLGQLNFPYIIIFIFSLVNINLALSKDKLFFINENIIKNLEEDTNNGIALLHNSYSYRILELRSVNGDIVEEISGSKDITFYYLPIIESLDKTKILDLVKPYSKRQKLSSSNLYLLLKFKGGSVGRKTLNLNIRTNRKQYTRSFNVSVFENPKFRKYDFNVWSYFDYNYLTKGVKDQIVSDLVNHNVNTLIIPPYVLPQVNSILAKDLQNLSNYLNGTSGKFNKYIIYFGGWSDRDINFMTNTWKKNYIHWINALTKVFESNGINFSDVILYPYDEPKGKSIEILKDIVILSRNLGIKNKFYVTISDLKAANLSKVIDIVQVHSDVADLVKEVLSYKSKKTIIWIYETNFSRGNLNRPKKYLDISYKAAYNNLSGIGIWSYADIKRENFKKFDENIPTWSPTFWQISDYNNSLIYKSDGVIYSSVRWEALAYGLEEMQWLTYYKQKYGEFKRLKFIKSLINGSISVNEWEKIKLNLI